MFKTDTNIVINSDKEIFIFELSREGEITYNVFNSKSISANPNHLDDENVAQFTTCIDTNDVIHLVLLLYSGEFCYYKYTAKIWVKDIIAQFNMQSNLYKQIEILMVGDQLHILYNYSNLINSNIWTIQHVVYNSLEKHNAIRYISKRNPDPFTVDVDNQGCIHLLYKTNSDDPQTYHSFYNPYRKSWTSNYKNLSSVGATSSAPLLFIDSQNNLHALWLKKLDSEYKIKYIKMSNSGKERYIWKDVDLTYISTSSYPPVIFQEKEKLKLLFLSNNNIECLLSSNYGESWMDSENREGINENMKLVKANSNLNKVNYVYCNLIDTPKLYYLDLLANENYPKTSEIVSLEENSIRDLDTIDEIDLELNKAEIDTLPILDTSSSISNKLDQILLNQKNLNSMLEGMQVSMDLYKPSFFSRLFK